MASTVEDLKQELVETEKQITAKNQEIKVLKQYKKSIENSMRLKQKVEGKPKPVAAKAETPAKETGAGNA